MRSKPTPAAAVKKGRPRQLEPEAVLDVAERVLHADGVGAVNMRRLATELGTGPMTLYGCFATKQALLEALARRLLDRHDLAPDASLPLAERTATWMHRYRVALRESHLFALMGAGVPLTVLLELAGAWSDQLVGEGFDQAIATERVLFLLWTVQGFSASEAGAANADRVRLRHDLAGLPVEARASAAAFVQGRPDVDHLFDLTVQATVAVFSAVEG